MISVLKLPADIDPLNFSLNSINKEAGDSAGDSAEEKTKTMRERYPQVHFWTKLEFDAFTLSAEGQNAKRGTAPYLEQENGKPVDPKDLAVFRNTLHSAWSELVHLRIAPPTWTKVCATGRETVHNIMIKAHPIFALDKDGFKLEMLCIADYSRWHRNNLTSSGNWKESSSRQASIKQESTEESFSSISPLVTKGKKREVDTTDGVFVYKPTKQSKSTC